jgi:hypothetical protein
MKPRYASIRFIVSIFSLILGYSGQGQNSFEITYSTTEDEEIFGGILHSSGYTYLVGRIGSVSPRDYDPLLLKISSGGELQVVHWELGDTNGYFPQILELENNNLMLIGQFGFLPSMYCPKIWLRIIDPECNVISDHIYSLDSVYVGILQDHYILDVDGNIVTLGAVSYYIDSVSVYTTADFCMGKYSQNGDSLLFQIFQIPDHIEEEYDLTVIPGTNQYLAVTSAYFNGMPDPQIARISHDFELINYRWFSRPELSTICSLNHWLTNSSYLISCLSIDLSGGHDEQVGVYKADTNANIIQSLELGKPDTLDYPAYYNSMEFVNDSTLYIGGFIQYIAFWPTDPSYVELYLVDTNLNLLGYRQFGGNINYRLQGILATSDGGCLMYASTYSDTNGYHERDIRIFKVPRDSIDIITSITTLPIIDSQNLLPYPNPVTDILHIPLGQSVTNPKIQIIKADGKKVLDKIESASGNLVTLDVCHLSSGIYIYQISSANKPAATGKFVKH